MSWTPGFSVPVPDEESDSNGGPFDKEDVGLGNVDNTSDADKPISDDQQAALDAKAGLNQAVGGALTGTLPNPDIANDYITNAHVAAGAAIAASKLDLSGTQSAIDRIFIPPQQFTLFTGTGTLPGAGIGDTNNNKSPAWQMKDAETGTWSVGLFFVPPHWLTLRAVAVIEQIATATPSGNVALVGRMGNFGDGEVMSMTAGSTVTPSAPAQFAQKHVELFTDRAVTASELCGFRFSRLGTDGGDTFANDCYLLGLILERVT